jgi:hypothetical protein
MAAETLVLTAAAGATRVMASSSFVPNNEGALLLLLLLLLLPACRKLACSSSFWAVEWQSLHPGCHSPAATTDTKSLQLLFFLLMPAILRLGLLLLLLWLLLLCLESTLPPSLAAAASCGLSAHVQGLGPATRCGLEPSGAAAASSVGVGGGDRPHAGALPPVALINHEEPLMLRLLLLLPLLPA